MNIIQMKYFVTVAKCLNFTKAADQLYITQPALSRQISAIEQELNIQLFIRTNRSVKLTPAARILLEEFQHIYDEYTSAVSKAQSAQFGLSGHLNIGILDGTRVDDLFPPVIKKFAKKYPNIELTMRNFSFNGLVERLYDGSLDFAITLFFDIAEHSNLMYRVIEKTRDHIVVPIDHPLAAKNSVHLSELRDETFIIVAYSDSKISPQLIIDECKRQGFMPNVRFSPSLQTSMLWVQAGMGIAMLDTRNMLYDNPNVKFLDVDQVSDPSLCLVWHQNNFNPYREVFGDMFMSGRENLGGGTTGS